MIKVIWSIISSLLAASVIIGAVLVAAGGWFGIRAVVTSGAPTKYLIRQTTRLVFRILVWFAWAGLLLGLGYWLAQNDEFWRLLFLFVPGATVLGWILLSLLWRNQFRPGFLFASWLPTEARQPMTRWAIDHNIELSGISMAEALRTVTPMKLDLSGEALLTTLQAALQAARIHMKRTTLFENVETNVVWDHLQALSQDLRLTIEKAPLVASFTVAELYSTGTKIGHDLARAGQLTEWGRMFINPLWLLQYTKLTGKWLMAPQEILQQEFTHWLHAEIYRMAYARSLHMYAEQDQIKAHPTTAQEVITEKRVGPVEIIEPSETAGPAPDIEAPVQMAEAETLHEARHTWWFLWSQLLLPVSLYSLAASVILIIAGGTAGLLVCLLVWLGMLITLRYSLSMKPWSVWLQQLALRQPSTHKKITVDEKAVQVELANLRQYATDLRKQEYPEPSQKGAHLLWTLQQTWEFSATYVGHRRDSSAPDLSLEYNFYLPDFFLALQYTLGDLQELYNSDSTFARVFRWLNERGFNPHLDRLEDWLEPPKQEPTSSTWSMLGQGLRTALKLSQRVPDPRIAITAKAMDWLIDKGKQMGEDSLHDLLVYIITDKMGWRMVQLFAHSLPLHTTDTTPRKAEQADNIQSLLKARRKTKKIPPDHQLPAPTDTTHAQLPGSTEEKEAYSAHAHEHAPQHQDPPQKPGSAPSTKSKAKSTSPAPESKAQSAPPTTTEAKSTPAPESKAQSDPPATNEAESTPAPESEAKSDSSPENEASSTPENNGKKKPEDLKPEAQQLLKAFRNK